MKGFLLNGPIALAKINVLIANRLGSRDLQDRILAWADERAEAVTSVPPVRRAIDGVEGAGADALDVVHGAVVSYTYPSIAQAVDLALQTAQELSPDAGGPYARSWIVVVNGQPWSDSIADIPSDAVVWVTNFAPYARRLEQGWHRARSARHRPGLFITETVRQAVQSAFPDLDVARDFVPLSSAPPGRTNWEVPYTRKRGEARGEPILYPAVVIRGR